MTDTEFLSSDELAEITGRKNRAAQRVWLDENGWTYAMNAAGRPIVGRWYARMRLAGVTPTASGALQHAWKPDFSALT